MGNILSCFKEKKPIIGVIHAKGTDDDDVMRRRAVSEINTYIETASRYSCRDIFRNISSGADDIGLSQ